MPNILNLAQIILSILLITVILLQQRGSGMSGVFGGGGNAYSSKRGFDKFLFNVTIVFVVLFLGIALARIVFQI